MQGRRAPLAVLAVGVVTAAALTVVASSDNLPAASAATATFTPVADTYVDDSATGTNFGTSGQLGVDGSPVKRIFLKFTVSGVSGAVTNAKLRLHTDDVSGSAGPSGGAFRAMSDTTWSETSVTWNNQPAVDGVSLTSLGPVSRNAWYEVDVTSLVRANGTYGIAVTSTSTDGADYDSRESGSATAPQLVLTTGTTTTTPGTGGDPVLVGAGDIADSGSGDSATAALLDGIPGTVFTTGDNVYDNGTAAEFTNYYDPTWGRHKARTRPSPGNHDYNTSGATGYYNYFGSVAGPSGQGYYSYDLGNWHIVSLNSNITTSAGSAQEKWLRADLAANTKPCTAAYWHHPLFTSGANHAPSTATRPLFQALYDYNADVVLFGHNHQYERFAPQNPSGALDTARGIRTFVAGMGGASHYSFGTIKPNSEVRNSDTYGVLKLTLHSDGFSWQFVPEAGRSFTDNGTTACH
ncbi:CBM96 family carbohydrate-binding protein [Saccharothrix syringae]|uniref:DNRLRE domain-containing protein n=1 Tax=Saccharothrix syringae TaxID=103733 RepID=A0A5Q0GVR3_SACSY|nr:DNRLRE domain-containing protein [Saccharothrix syringae]QFZ18157.1 DNRLRE domain-containing protein [Saccharothrix syringae]